MVYEEFEWHILRLVYEEGIDRLRPSYLAYTLGLSHEEVNQHLEQAIEQNVLETNLLDNGHTEYYIPGVERDKLPVPLWKQQQQPPQPTNVAPQAITRAPSEPKPQTSTAEVEQSAYQQHVSTRDNGADGTAKQTQAVVAKAVAQGPVVVARHASPLEHHGMSAPVTASASATASTALVPYSPSGGALLQIDAPGDAFCDASQTIFMRQLRIHGVQSEALLRDHIHRLFESFGYKLLNQSSDRMRFERGSVTFILALVPLFVLILPLFVYLFLYCMGRSTIQQEPLELDVHIRRSELSPTTYDIDLTFIGLHGVVLGSADQRVLNQEIETLREELRWALAGS